MFGHEVVVGVLLYMPSFFARKMTKDGFQAFVMGLTVSFCSTGTKVYVAVLDLMIAWIKILQN